MRFSLLLAAALLVPLSFAAPKETALDRYVKAPDPSYRFQLVRSTKEKNFTAHLLELTSQTWRSPQEVDRPEWKHWLTIIQPNEVKSRTGLLFITGGANNGRQPTAPDLPLLDAAITTQTVVAELRMVPNQPLAFLDDKGPDGQLRRRSEDAMIAYTWDKFLQGGDERWPARLPMVKSAVRAMDAVTAFCASPEGGQLAVDRFVLAGASKRGWTAWDTAAVDPRVAAIIPLVIDVLNMEPSFIHHYRAYGFYAPAVGDYQTMKIMEWNGHPRMRELQAIEDPYAYRDRLTMPKFMVNAAGDQFFLPDSSRFYFDDLKGEKHLRYVPNADHSLRNSDAVKSLIAFYASFVTGTPRPEYRWSFEKNGDIHVTTTARPAQVTLWAAHNPTARDFRLESIGPAYQATVLQAEDGVYRARAPKADAGYTAYFIELSFPSGSKYPFTFTTPVRVTPDTYPFAAPVVKR